MSFARKPSQELRAKALRESPLAEVAGTVLRADKANLIFDQILVKEPRTSTETLRATTCTHPAMDVLGANMLYARMCDFRSF